MTGSAPGRPHGAPVDPGAWIRGITAGLSAAGLATDLHETTAGLDVTAVVQQPGRRETEVIVDEDGYIELRWWTSPGATPAEVTSTITRALAAITTAPPAVARDGVRP
jgi:hypothetical protein